MYRAILEKHPQWTPADVSDRLTVHQLEAIAGGDSKLPDRESAIEQHRENLRKKGLTRAGQEDPEGG